MERKHKLIVPKPCHENWNKMSRNENGRFCMSCSKTVVDFTSMLPDEIQHFFIQNQNNKICGRFKKSQLDEISIHIPSRVLYTQTQYQKMFLLALFIAMGTTLFSCVNKDGQKQKIEKVEIVKDTVQKERIVIGKIPINKNDKVHSIVPPPPPPKVDQVKFTKPVNEGKLKTDKHNNSCEQSASKSDKNSNKKNSSLKEPIYVTGEIASETNAEFPGGVEQFYSYFGKEFKKPQDLKTDNLKITLSFAVEKNGSVSYLKSLPDIDKTLENEIVRVLKSCPKWQPGQSDGKKVKRQYSLPIVLQ